MNRDMAPADGSFVPFTVPYAERWGCFSRRTAKNKVNSQSKFHSRKR